MLIVLVALFVRLFAIAALQRVTHPGGPKLSASDAKLMRSHSLTMVRMFIKALVG